MYLGPLALPKEQWRALAAVLEERLGGQRPLFPADPVVVAVADSFSARHEVRQAFHQAASIREATEELVSINLADIASSVHRSLGPEIVGNSFFDRLGLPEILAQCGFNAYQRDLARAVIVGRLLQPGSDLSTWRWMRNSSSLPDFVPSDLEKAGKDAVYEIADQLWQHKDELETGLRKREQTLFPTGESIMLYDLTNAHFEGRCLGNSLAKRGKSKQHRMDCPLVTLALAVDSYGFPLFTQIYEGNQSEPATLADVLKRLKADGGDLFAPSKPTLIMDRGIATADNLIFLATEGYPYLVIERRDAAKDFEADFALAPQGFTQVSGEVEGERVYIRKVEPVQAENEGTKPADALLLCYSEGRKEKERGIDSLKEKRWLEDLESIKRTIARGKIKDPGKVQRRVGRLCERYPSVAHHYDVKVELDTDAKRATGLTWMRLPERDERETRQGSELLTS
jgi:hypothetical protein